MNIIFCGFTESEVLNMLSQKVDEIGTQKEAAKLIGISEQYLSDILNGRRKIGKNAYAYLGLRKEERYFETLEANDG